jgi:Domain of unknown function (DUF4352)
MRRRIVIVIALVVAAAIMVFGFSLLSGGESSEPLYAPGSTARLGDLTATADTATWVDMDHDMGMDASGYPMPPAMMPGMPETGEQRLAVTVTVVNTGSQTRPLRVREEFALRADEPGDRWTTHSDSFGDLPRIAPGNAVRGVLFFDLPPHSPVWLEWHHEGVVTGLALAAAAHSEHS